MAQATWSIVQNGAPGHVQVKRQSLLDEILAWYHWWLLCRADSAVLHMGSTFSYSLSVLEVVIAYIHGYMAPLSELKVSLLVWHWICVQLPCVQLLYLHFYSLLLMPMRIMRFIPVFGNSLCEVTLLHERVKSHISFLKLMSWNRAAPNLKGWSDPQGWAKPSPPLMDKEMLAWKEGLLRNDPESSFWVIIFTFFLTSHYSES